MIAKCARKPKTGGSARANVRYILGYAVGEKNGDERAQNEQFWALMNEARERDEQGVGSVWAPADGDGKRPAALYAEHVTSLATADLEMQAFAAANGQVNMATYHEIFSFNESESRRLSDTQAIEAVLDVFQRVGYAEVPKILTVHRDTIADDGTGNLHVHVALGAVDPNTMRAIDRTMIHTRYDRGARETEIARDLEHDRGLVVVRLNDGTKYIDASTYAERKAWARENRAERLAELERRRYGDVEGREGSFARYADANVEPRIRQALRRSQEAKEEPFAIDAMNAAARRGTKIEIVGEGEEARAFLRDVSTGDFRRRQSQTLRDFKADLDARVEKRLINGEQRDEDLRAFQKLQSAELQQEMQRVEREGELVPLSDRMQRELGDIEQYRDVASAEEAFANAIENDAGRVARDITRQESTFSRDDVARYIAQRVTDVGEIERLCEHVMNHDAAIVLLSPDVAGGVYTTKEMLRVEQDVAKSARELAQTRDDQFNGDSLARAITAMEMQRGFALSDEQRAVLEHFDKQLVVGLGVSGAGKTTVMEAARRYADENGQTIVGVTLSQAAAERLEHEAGFRSVNSARALLDESLGREIAPRGGILVIDEAGMVDSRTMQKMLDVAAERDCKVVAIGDTRQLAAIGAGGAFMILAEEAREADTFTALNEIRRQKNEWHRDSVYAMSDGIGHHDETKIARADDLWEKNGALRFTENCDEAIQEAVAWYNEQRQKSDDVLLIASDKDTVRYLNEEIRRQIGHEDKGHWYVTEGGRRQLTEGDRFIFGENKRFGDDVRVVNGDTGTVVGHERYKISVRLDRTGDVVTFDSRKYDKWDHGWASTVHKAQGASVRAEGAILDESATAELAHVATSRSKEELGVFVPRSSFANATELAEHLGERITDKGTTQDLSGELDAYGGPDTYFARNMRAQAASSLNPDVRAYERAQAVKAAVRESHLAQLRDEYRARRAAAEPSEHAQINREQRAAERQIFKEFGPDHKVTWLTEYRAQRAAVDERVRHLRDREGRDARTDRAAAREKMPIHNRTHIPDFERAERENRERPGGHTTR